MEREWRAIWCENGTQYGARMARNMVREWCETWSAIWCENGAQSGARMARNMVRDVEREGHAIWRENGAQYGAKMARERAQDMRKKNGTHVIHTQHVRFKLRGLCPLRPRFKGGALSGSP